MKKMRLTYLLIGLMSLLLLTACGEKNTKSTTTAATVVHKTQQPEETGLKVIDVRDFISVTFSGLDTFGTAEVSVDFEALAEQVFDGEYTMNDLEDLSEYYFSARAEKSSGLSNGDTFIVHINDDLDIYDCRAEDTELPYKVRGLEEMKTVDVFADLVVTFEGYNASGYATVDNPATDLFLQSVTYKVTPTGYRLSDGEIITVHANYSEETARRYGCVAESLEKEYIVEGLGYFIDYPEQIDDRCVEFMVKNGVPVVEDMIDHDFEDIVDLLGCEEPHSYQNASYSIVPTGNVYHFSPKGQEGSRRTMMFFEVSVSLPGADPADHAPCTGTVYAGLVFGSLCVRSDKTIDADVPMRGVYNWSGLHDWSDFALSESTIYEHYREAYRENHICYEPVVFSADNYE